MKEGAVELKPTLDEAWARAEAALPAHGLNGRYIVLDGPIASGVYWARAPLFDGNRADQERRERREPAGFGGSPPNGSPATALMALAVILEGRSGD